MNEKDIYPIAGEEFGTKYTSDFILYLKDDKTGVEVWTFKREDIFCIFFRASNEWKDWITNFIFCKKKYPYSSPNTSGVKMHGRYVDGYMKLRDDLLNGYKASGCSQCLVLGYSMGFGLSTICALDIQYNFKLEEDKIACIGSGPRVFNKAGQISFNKRVPNTFRYKYGNDIVCDLPPEVFGFYHVGKYVHIGPKDVWYKASIMDHTKSKLIREYIKNECCRI